MSLAAAHVPASAPQAEEALVQVSTAASPRVAYAVERLVTSTAGWAFARLFGLTGEVAAGLILAEG